MADGPEKPVRIWNQIGRRPLLAAGNSNGDSAMLEFTHHPNRPTLRLLLLHEGQGDPVPRVAFDQGLPGVALGPRHLGVPIARQVDQPQGPDRPDDAEREFDTRVGAEQALSQAEADGWTVVSIKNDWATVLASWASSTAGIRPELRLPRFTVRAASDRPLRRS